MDNWNEKMKEVMKQANSIKKGYASIWMDEIKKHKKICIFGAGEHGICWYLILKKYNINVDYFCDNKEEKWGQEIVDHTKCLPPGEMLENSDDLAVIIAVRSWKAIYEQVNTTYQCKHVFIASLNKKNYEINYECIGNQKRLEELYEKMVKVVHTCCDDISKEICYQTLYQWLIDDNSEITYNGEAYFYMKEIGLSSDEYLVDAGAFDGDTIQSFKAAVNNKFGRIYAFEMDKRNFTNLKKKYGIGEAEEDARIELYQMGISNKKGLMHYSSNYQTSELSDEGNEVCEIGKLDFVLQDKKVTMIKMDIEGSEQNALKGTEEIIKKQSPKLAICIYHSMEDFLEIPLYLKRLNPNYKILIRHHSYEASETVCYAYED